MPVNLKPRIPRKPSVRNKLKGTPTAPRSFRFTREEVDPGKTPPPWWVHSDLEWIVYRYLTEEKGYVVYGAHQDPKGPKSAVGADVLYQVPIPAPGYKLNNKFRGDFWVLPTGKNGPSPYPYVKGIVLDPVNPWTHRDTNEDRFRAAILGAGGYLLIWLDGTALYAEAKRVIDLALRGVDVSSIGRRAR